jgi:hypothetical protein
MEPKKLQIIPPDVTAEVHHKLTEIKELLESYAITLTPEERHDLYKMGDKSFTFVEKSHDYAIENPRLVPFYLDMPSFTVNFNDAHGLWPVRNDAQQVFEMIDDTTMAAGGEAFQAALVFYSSVREAAHRDVPGAKAVYDELKKRYPGHKQPKTEDKKTKTEDRETETEDSE